MTLITSNILWLHATIFWIDTIKRNNQCNTFLVFHGDRPPYLLKFGNVDTIQLNKINRHSTKFKL